MRIKIIKTVKYLDPRVWFGCLRLYRQGDGIYFAEEGSRGFESA